MIILRLPIFLLTISHICTSRDVYIGPDDKPPPLRPEWIQDNTLPPAPRQFSPHRRRGSVPAPPPPLPPLPRNREELQQALNNEALKTTLDIMYFDS